MNSKKNKNKNKPKPNPSPPQKVESTSTVDKNEETIEEKPDITIKSDERVPEIISEIAAPSVETRVLEGDTPKKPKRNRGKKKKSDKDEDNDDNQEQKAPESGIEEVKGIAEINEDKLEIDTSMEITNITPAARKKKNKNKKSSEHPTEDQKPIEKESKSTPINVDTTSEIEQVKTQVKHETISPETFELTEQESKTSRKKNKKKKRSDSERSDKADDAIACTVAFQQLLEPKEEKTDSKVVEKSIVQDTIFAEVVKEDVKVDLIKENIENKAENVEAISQTESVTPEPFKEEGGKGKKKNKKDKKHPPNIECKEQEPKQLEIESITEVQPLSVTKTTDIITGDIPKEHVIEEQPDIINLEITSPVRKEKSPKLNAKIAKPVEKKHMEKSGTKVEPEDTISPKSIVSEEKNSGLQIETETSVLKDHFEQKEEKIKTDIPDTVKLEYTSEEKEKPIDNPQRPENIKLPESGMGKKRKKSPKPPKRIYISAEVSKPEFELIEKPNDGNKKYIETPMEVIPTPIHLGDIPTKDSNNSTIEVKYESFDTIKPSDNTDKKSELKLSVAMSIPTATEAPIQDRVEQVKVTEPAYKTKQTEVSEQIFEEQKSEQMPVPDMGKKKKKSPKLTKKLETKPDIKELVTVMVTESTTTNKTDEGVKEERKDKAESPLNLPPLEDIEICSAKSDESGRSASDVLPDIHYPRATSQLFDNNNNNLIIQEISTEHMNLNIPLVIPDTPFIQGSGETPIITQEIIHTGIRITEIDTTITKPKEEKTDLKSKVMEVNKDMEELRKSIEKSLAELTVMEKTEKETEKPFHDCQIKLEDTKPIEFKQDTIAHKEKIDMSSEITAKPKLETVKIECEDIKTQTMKPESTSIPIVHDMPIPPVCPSRKDNKGKNKSKKKGRQDAEHHAVGSTTVQSGTSPSSTTPSSATGGSTTGSSIAGSSTTASSSTVSETKECSQDTKKGDQSEHKTDNSQGKGKQQCSSLEESSNTKSRKQDVVSNDQGDYNLIENFEDAMTSSADDVNQSFEMIANEADKTFKLNQSNIEVTSQVKPEISITVPIEEEEKTARPEKSNPVSQPKNLIGHPDIPARLNKTDYKKEKNKTQELAKVKIKDAVPVEVNKQSKDAQSGNKENILKDRKSIDETLSMTDEKDEYIYKYSFRKVFLPSACHICKKELKQSRVPCSYCNLIFYCSPKHKDEDYAQHQAFCFAVSTLVHLKDQKFIYADTRDVTGHNYRLLRMQMIVSCEKVLKRKLAPWEQEALLYPRICADVGCREWRQGKLKDCEGCGQLSYCTDHPDHFPKSHQRWCNSYCLYQKLVCYQQSSGRLVPKLPSRVMMALYQIPEKLNEVLASMYEEKIDINDTQYAALTQVATAPLTAAYSHQLYINKMNSTYANGVHKNSFFTIHVVGAELQFEADALNKWEVFFLHLRPDVKELKVVLIGPDLNSSNLPLALLGKMKLCDNCNENKRRVKFDFHDKKTYYEFWSTEYSIPDLVCAFNPSIHRASTYNGKDTWPSTIKCILKLKVPFVVTSYSMAELERDLARIKECAEVELNTISEPKLNSFGSVRPDRNFISDDEIPLLFKNYCFFVICGAF